MSNLLEITGDDIAQLDDTDLRSLIGQLCEADYRSAGLPTKGITWGGHQNAPDGGLDVVVRGDTSPPSKSFVPRSPTGFQVKKPEMSRSAIRREMQPDGVLREVIKGLMRDGGAYIIVSSGSSTSDTALADRVEAMKESVANEDNLQNFHLDFFDRGRVATWVRTHPFLILWVRKKIGRSLNGWRPYENWANAPDGVTEEYLLDDGLRLHDGTKSTHEEMSVEEGLLRLRTVLSAPRTSARLAGLSGVGKTRLVQALFDESVGKQPLDPSQAFYTDMADSPDPAPIAFAEQLIADKTRAILIVDNCPPDLHSRLAPICSRTHSTVSLLTVEYDVRDDLPDETRVFRLEPASADLIETLVRKRFPHISQVDAQTIADFSGGNARVAIALANTIERDETLSGFRDEELFKRLFWQRHNPNDSLLISAEACSLVYSFEGTDADSEKSELKFLASLVRKAGADLYRDVKALKDRDLVQSRDVWRAVLPHAIANRLASKALESIPKASLEQAFLNSGSERLIKSFTRRLSYLHDCDTAVEIVNNWLDPAGWIGKASGNFNSFGMDVFRNIAPVSPEKALEAMERAAKGSEGGWFTSRQNTHYYEFVQILRYLAYDPELFDRSVKLMCRFALSEMHEGRNNSVRDVLKSLFYIYRSGTHAPIEARAKVIEELVDSGEQNSTELGFLLLGAALEAWHFYLRPEFSFGARPRDYGYHPQNRSEIIHWFETFIGICTRLALSGQPIAKRAKETLADNLRGLWTKGGMFETLENSAKQIRAQQAWNEGWVAVREIIRHDKSLKEDVRDRLYALEKLLKPNDLLETARTFALSKHHHTFDLEDDFGDEEDASSGWRRAEEKTREIGAKVAQDTETLNALLPELVSTENIRLQNFGRGLAEGCQSKQDVWQVLRSQFEKTPPSKQNFRVLLGFLFVCAESDPEFYHSTLDGLVNDSVLGEWFPIFQNTSTIDERGVQRLHQALDVGIARVGTFRYLAQGRAEAINDDDLADLLRKILSKQGGIHVAIEILNMRFFREKDESSECSTNLIAAARDVLTMYLSYGEHGHDKLDSDLAKIAGVCLKGEEGKSAAIKICREFMEAISENRIHSFTHSDLLNSLAHTQPFVFLDSFLGSDEIEGYRRRRTFSNDYDRNNNPLNQIPDEDIILWCDSDPEKRYPLIASAIQAFPESEEKKELAWRPIVESIFEKAPDLAPILDHLADDLRGPTSYSGSLADTLENRSVLFLSLYEHDNAEISAWAKRQYANLQEEIKRERDLEVRRRRRQNESFE